MRRDLVAERIRRLSPAKRLLLERLLEEKSYDNSDMDDCQRLKEAQGARDGLCLENRDSSAGGCVSPRSPLEAHLAQIWNDVLGLDGVGVEDNFFDLGGDSILSIRIVAKAQSRGIPLSSRLLFEAPTIAALANLLEHRWSPSHAAESSSSGARQLSPGPAESEPSRPSGLDLSPGDFPEAELSQEDLSTVLARVATRARVSFAQATDLAPRHAAAL